MDWTEWKVNILSDRELRGWSAFILLKITPLNKISSSPMQLGIFLELIRYLYALEQFSSTEDQWQSGVAFPNERFNDGYRRMIFSFWADAPQDSFKAEVTSQKVSDRKADIQNTDKSTSSSKRSLSKATQVSPTSIWQRHCSPSQWEERKR